MDIYVLVTISNGTVADVKFYRNLSEAIYDLNDLLEFLDLDNDSASIFSPRGMVFQIGKKAIKNGYSCRSNETFIIANPLHSLGFLVVGHHEPVGYHNLVKALYHLEKNRKEMGCHIELYQAMPVKNLKVKKTDSNFFCGQAE